jgi:GT2 family glycosyltransferase
MSKSSIAILITNYNTWNLTQHCARQCYLQDDGKFNSLLVYDDCSTTEFTETFPEGTRIHMGTPNVGLIKALNRAFSLVSEDIVVLFDSDAYPTTPFCEDVAAMFERDTSLGLLALRTVGNRGNPTESYTTEPNFWSLLLGQKLYAKVEKYLADRSGRISVFTCAMAVRRQAFLELNGFDEAFDWLDLDHDFSMRVNRSAWKIAIAPGPRVFHEGGGTPQLTRNRVLRFYQNRWYLLKKFDRLPMERLIKGLILFRLRVEYLFLKLFGAIFISDEAIRADKLSGREQLIEFCQKMV